MIKFALILFAELHVRSLVMK